MGSERSDYENDALVMNRVDSPAAYRDNIWKYSGKKGMTITDLARKSAVPVNTINSFLHNISSDMKVSNAARIAKALDISIDELIGADTLNDITKESLALCRELPENDLYLVRWFIRYLTKMNSLVEPNKRYLSAMEVECATNGNLKITTNYKKVDITNVSSDIKGKVFFGITMPCDHYMPYYSPYDVLLIANDRLPQANEHAVIQINGCLFISKRKVDKGIAKYYSIRDGKYRIDESDIDDLVGYVAGKILR